MKVIRMEYPIKHKRKYKVIHNNKEYICYLNAWGENMAIIQNDDQTFEDITDTKLGMEIILSCFHN